MAHFINAAHSGASAKIGCKKAYELVEPGEVYLDSASSSSVFTDDRESSGSTSSSSDADRMGMGARANIPKGARASTQAHEIPWSKLRPQAAAPAHAGTQSVPKIKSDVKSKEKAKAKAGANVEARATSGKPATGANQHYVDLFTEVAKAVAEKRLSSGAGIGVLHAVATAVHGPHKTGTDAAAHDSALADLDTLHRIVMGCQAKNNAAFPEDLHRAIISASVDAHGDAFQSLNGMLSADNGDLSKEMRDHIRAFDASDLGKALGTKTPKAKAAKASKSAMPGPASRGRATVGAEARSGYTSEDVRIFTEALTANKTAATGQKVSASVAEKPYEYDSGE